MSSEAESLDASGSARSSIIRKQALRLVKSIAARRAKRVRARGIRMAGIGIGAAGAAELLAQARAQLAALPPGFTDDLRHAPPFPADAPEILGGD
ncbi:hypothetical protein HNR00_000842 [Methylorubrum rhodinum]|uniref:Uncharacterized protein n=1 Tax=Methylorubrum rhodinum TaxID=29428 RepID=A0A840ZEX2_9HYPH|nr:hypothetical protein [Methylorubrum rhodinum]MBB5756146.1 hypothetical protein [Methylorubrum rhodinum]